MLGLVCLSLRFTWLTQLSLVDDMTERIRTYLERFQSISRIGRKPKPVVFIDFETRAQVDEHMGKVLCMAYKVGDEPVRIISTQEDD